MPAHRLVPVLAAISLSLAAGCAYDFESLEPVGR
jgi:hypothetical protein